MLYIVLYLAAVGQPLRLPLAGEGRGEGIPEEKHEAVVRR